MLASLAYCNISHSPWSGERLLSNAQVLAARRDADFIAKFANLSVSGVVLFSNACIRSFSRLGNYSYHHMACLPKLIEKAKVKIGQMSLMMLVLVPGTLIGSIIATVIAVLKSWRSQKPKQESPKKSTLLVLVSHYTNVSFTADNYLPYDDKESLSVLKVRHEF